MIRTFKDAEIQINLLMRRVEFLERQTKTDSSSTENTETIVKEVRIEAPPDLDKEVSIDEATIRHKFFHIFQNILAYFIEATDITITRIAQLFHTRTFTLSIDDPTYFRPWTITNKSDFPDGGATSDRGLLINDENGVPIISFLTAENNVGGTYATFRRIRCDAGFVPNGTRNLGNTTDKWDTIYCNNLNVATSITAVAEGGVTAFPVVRVSSVGHTTATLNYKDHAGTNQSLTIVTSVTPTSVNDSYKAGIKTL